MSHIHLFFYDNGLKAFLSSCDEISRRVSNAPLITFTGCLVTLNRELKRALICKIDKDGVNCKIVKFFCLKNVLANKLTKGLLVYEKFSQHFKNSGSNEFLIRCF